MHARSQIELDLVSMQWALRNYRVAKQIFQLDPCPRTRANLIAAHGKMVWEGQNWDRHYGPAWRNGGGSPPR
jgi:hypothetical protein